MTLSFKRLILMLALVLPAAAVAASPVLAASHARTRFHHLSIHKANAHRTHSKRTMTPTAS